MPFSAGDTRTIQEIKRLLAEEDDLDTSLREQRIINLHLSTMVGEVFTAEDIDE